jgi:serine/threonine-protein kinase SRPK3
MSCHRLIPLCRNDEYVVVKVYVRTPPGRVNREKAAYEHLANLSTTHPGRHNIRQALDIFDLSRPEGEVHVCIVHSPLQSTLYDFQRLDGAPQVLPEELVKMVMINLLEALDFLHTEANVTHCGMAITIHCSVRMTDSSHDRLEAFQHNAPHRRSEYFCRLRESRRP